MSSLQEYTLMIVESESVASIIRQFNIPYLEVIATHGFCWRPQFNWNKNILEMRAVQEQRPVRKLLKEKAPWAVKIIIATDSDSAGEFIAHSIVKFLKLSKIHRTYLNCLTETSVRQSIRNAKYYKEEPFHEMLNRFIIHHYLDKIFADLIGKHAWIKLGILDLFNNKIQFSQFGDIRNRNNHFVSENPIMITYRDSFHIQKDGKCKTMHLIPKPFNTAKILERIHTRYKNFSDAQHALNQLFTMVQKDSKHALITYPRSGECGYYESTWINEYDKWIRNKPSETFAPAPVWSITTMDKAHEGIHPADITLSPETIRPMVRKELYDMYKIIYEHHQKVISNPDEITKDCFYFKDAGINENLLPLNDSQNDSYYDVSPVVSISNLLDYLVSKGPLKPSGFGNVLDILIRSKWLRLNGNDVIPGILCETMAGKINSFETLEGTIALLNHKIHLPDLNKSKLFEDLTRISHIIFKS